MNVSEQTMNGPKKKILFNTQFHWAFSSFEYCQAMALRQRGHDVLMVVCDGLPKYCEQQTLKYQRPTCEVCLNKFKRDMQRYQLPFVTIGQFLDENDCRQADQMCQQATYDELLSLQVHGMTVGKMAWFNLFKYYKGYPFNIEGERLEVFRDIVHSTILLALAKKKIFDQYSPDVIVTANGRVSQWAPFVQLAQQKGIDYVVWEDIAGKDRPVMIKRNDLALRQRIDDELWEYEKNIPLTEAERDELQTFFKRWKKGDYSFHAKFYEDFKTFDEKEFRSRLNLREGAPVVSLYTSVLWDSTSIDYDRGFDNMFDWLLKTIEYARVRPDVEFVIRAHPHEASLPDMWKTSTPACEIIRQNVSELPENVKLVEPDSDLDSYALSDISDVNMVYVSTFGMELLMQGKKVWVAGDAFYANKGFTVDIQSAEHMAELLDNNTFDNRLTAQERQMAEKLIHITKIRRIVSDPYVKVNQRTVDIQDLRQLNPGQNPVLDDVCDYILGRKKYSIDFGKRTEMNHPQAVPEQVAGSQAAQTQPQVRQDIYSSEVEFNGLKIRYDNLPALKTEIKNIFQQGIYDFRADNPSPLVIDGGAHLGLFSLYTKQKYPNARIIAFEPDEKAYATLNVNLAENQSAAQVQTIKSGLFNENTTLRFAGNESDGGKIKSDGDVQIDVVKLSQYINEPIDFLKLNIEGAQLEVLEEMEHKLGLVKEICLEYHGFPEIGQRLHQILDILDRNGFRYLIHDFDAQTNAATKPPFYIDEKKRFYLLIYAKRVLAPKAKAAEPVVSSDELVRTEPVSRLFGLDRGTSICRYYLDKHLSANRHLITGRVLEIGDNKYTQKYGTNVTQSEILNATPIPQATIVGDFQTGENIPENAFDCIILTQVLECIYDAKSAVKNAVKALKPGGALILTDNGIGPISRYDMDRWGDFWRFTDKSYKMMLTEFLPEELVSVRTYGNVAAAKAYIDGRCAEELDPKVLDVEDRDYQSVIAAVARKSVAVTNDPQTTTGRQNSLGRPEVLIYHRVADEMVDAQYLAVSPENFEAHLKELKANYRVVSLRQLLEETQSGQTQPNTVALTFDDGYLDNLTNALPLLEQYGIHATIFVTTGNVEKARGFWGDKVEYLLLGNHTLPPALDINDHDNHYNWPLETAAQRLVAHDQIRKLLRDKTNQEIELFVDSLLRWAGINVNLDTFRPPLNITQLCQLAQSPCIEIGAHTETHTKLSVLTPTQQQREMIESKQKLESWLGAPVTIFSYPYGSARDYTADTKAIAQQVGFQYAIANVQGSVSQSPDLFEIPRRLVRNWDGMLFAQWMRHEDKTWLERETMAQRTEIVTEAMSSCAAPFSAIVSEQPAPATISHQVVRPKVVLCTLWRSGTHWMGNLLSEILKVPWKFESMDPNNDRSQEIIKQLQHSDENMIRVMHIPCEPEDFYKLSDPLGFKVVFVHRDVRDVLASNVNMRKFNEGYRQGLPPFPDMSIDEILKWDLDTYKDMFNVTLPNWINNDNPNQVTVSYEQLKTETFGTLRRVVDSLGLEVTDGRIQQAIDKCDFKRVTKRKIGTEDKSAVVRKGIIGDHKNQFNTEQLELIESYLAV